MITRRDVLADAIDKCIRELYSLAQPSVNYDNFIKENKAYLEKEKEYYSLPKDNRPSYREYMGPKPYEFYYLPREVFKEVADSYVNAYKFDDKQEFLDTINILKEYCKNPIVDKYIEGELREDGTRWPGHRGYEHPDNLKKELRKIFDDKILPDICKQYNKQYNLQTTGIESSVSMAYSQIFQNKFFEFLDMAGNFYEFNRYLNTFNMHVYLGGTPSSNKESVIENWKKYRNIDIEIDESKYNEEDEE